jgi:hypothetical protein
MKLYYLWINDQQTGPFTVEQIRSMWSQGSIGVETLFWIEGSPEWLPLKNIIKLVQPPAQKTVEVASQKRGSGCIKPALIFLIVAFFGLMIVGLTSSEVPRSTYELKSEAFEIAKDWVQERLKAPSTAEFCDFNDTKWLVEEDEFTVQGWVDSENSFGAKLRNKWQVKMIYHPGQKDWTLQKIDIFPR